MLCFHKLTKRSGLTEEELIPEKQAASIPEAAVPVLS